MSNPRDSGHEPHPQANPAAATTPPGDADDPASAWVRAVLWPHCCTSSDIPDFEPTAEVLTPLAECARCGFRFPVLPGEFARVTLDSLHHHQCTGTMDGNWQGLGDAIVTAIRESAITGASLAERLSAHWPHDTLV